MVIMCNDFVLAIFYFFLLIIFNFFLYLNCTLTIKNIKKLQDIQRALKYSDFSEKEFISFFYFLIYYTNNKIITKQIFEKKVDKLSLVQFLNRTSQFLKTKDGENSYFFLIENQYQKFFS
jgi:hypothetical protein